MSEEIVKPNEDSGAKEDNNEGPTTAVDDTKSVHSNSDKSLPGLNFDIDQSLDDTDGKGSPGGRKTPEDLRLNTLAEIHRTFSAVINEFRGDKSADRFMQEYEKLYEALKKTHREMKTLQYKCASLQSEIKHNAERVNLAIHLSQEDRGMISTLNKQMQEAWSVVEVMNDREAKAKHAVSSMKEEIHVLMSLVEEGMGMEELQNLSEKAAAERKSMEETLAEMKEQSEMMENKYSDTVSKLKDKEQSLENEVKDLKHTIESMRAHQEEERQRNEQCTHLCNRLTRQGNRLKSEKLRLEMEIEGWKKKVKVGEDHIVDLQNDVQRNFRDYKTQKEEARVLGQRVKLLTTKVENLNLKILKQEETIDNLDSKEKTLIKSLEEKSGELVVSQEKKRTLEYECKSLTTQVKQLEASLVNCQEMRAAAQSYAQTVVKSTNETQQKLTTLTLKCNRLMSLNEAAHTKLLKAGSHRKELETVLHSNRNVNKDLVNEVANMNEIMKRISETINSMVSEKDRLLRKIDLETSNVMKLEEEVVTKDSLVLMAEKSRAEMENTLKLTRESLVHTLNRRDQVVNAMRKMEVFNNHLKTANNNMGKQIKSVSDEVIAQGKKIDLLSNQKLRLKKELADAHTALIDEAQTNKLNKVKIKDLQKDVHSVEALLHKSSYKIDQFKLYIEQIISQRNILGLQCVRRREEVKMLSEKNHVLADIIKIGNMLYRQRHEEIKWLSSQGADLYRQKHDVMKKVENIDNLKSKLGLANQQLVQYQARCKAMEGESTMNFHKWRHLKAKDMSKFEMVLKIQHLTKQLILKSDLVARLEATLKDKAMVMDHMKKQMARFQWQGNTHSQMALERKQTDVVKRKLKVALAESNMAQWVVQEHKEERDKLVKKLDGERKKRLQLRKQLGRLPPITESPRIADNPAGLELQTKKYATVQQK